MVKGNLLRSFACSPIAIYNPKDIRIQRTESKEDRERIVCNLVGLIGRPWEGILNIENIASPFSRVNIEPSDWKRKLKGFC